MSKFSEWELAKLDERFNLTQVNNLPALQQWLDGSANISDLERQILLTLQQGLAQDVLHWNEQELFMNFIAPVFRFVDFSSPKFNLFAERYLSGTVDGESISGNPDGMIASGWREPKVPYFCLQEYKPQKDPHGDPVAQCLAAMLVAQELNQHQRPIYGCYVLGRSWSFMVLQGREYAISLAYDSTKPEIFDIFRILKALKAMIIGW